MLEGAGDGAALTASLFPSFNNAKMSLIFIPLSGMSSFSYKM